MFWLQEEAMLREYYTSTAQSDEFAGLMTPRERQWIVNIQLQQLKVCYVIRLINYNMYADVNEGVRITK